MVTLRNKKTKEQIEVSIDEFVDRFKKDIKKAFWRHIAGEINIRKRFMNVGDLLNEKEEDLAREILRQSWLKMAAREAANRFWGNINNFNLETDGKWEIVSCEEQRVFNITVNELEQLHPSRFVPEAFSCFTEI